MNHREVAKRVLRIATGTEPTEDQVDRLVDASKDGLRVRFVTVDWARAKTSSEESCESVVDEDPPFKAGDVVECVNTDWTTRLVFGSKYTVTKVRTDGEFLELGGDGFVPGEGWSTYRFRLVSRAKTSSEEFCKSVVNDPLPGFSRGIGGR